MLEYCVFGEVILIDESAINVNFIDGYTERIMPY